jgi:hypothetical protein
MGSGSSSAVQALKAHQALCLKFFGRFIMPFPKGLCSYKGAYCGMLLIRATFGHQLVAWQNGIFYQYSYAFVTEQGDIDGPTQTRPHWIQLSGMFGPPVDDQPFQPYDDGR